MSGARAEFEEMPGSLGPTSPASDADRIVRAIMIVFDL